MNKSGQGLSITTLILIVLGVVVLVVVILGFTIGFENIIGKFRLVPELEPVAQLCQTSVQQGFETSYCKDFKEVKIGGKTQYVNCDYSGLAFEGKGGITCDVAPKDTEEVAYCKRVRTSQGDKFKDDILVNGKECGKGWKVTKEASGN